MSAAEKILLEALALPRNERSAVAAKLLESLEPAADDDIEAAWSREIERRVEKIRAGAPEGLPAQDVHARLRAALARR